MADVDWDLRPRLIVSAAVGSALVVSLLQALLVDGTSDFDRGRFAARVAVWSVVLLALQVGNIVHIRSKQRRGEFVVVLGGYAREEVDRYLANVAMATAGGHRLPPKPKFTTAWRGYEPTQVDHQLDTLLRPDPDVAAGDGPTRGSPTEDPGCS